MRECLICGNTSIATTVHEIYLLHQITTRPSSNSIEIVPLFFKFHCNFSVMQFALFFINKTRFVFSGKYVKSEHNVAMILLSNA